MIEAVDLVLWNAERGETLARAPLPAAARERLAADAALMATLAGVLPHDGSAFELASFGLSADGATLDVALTSSGARFARSYPPQAVRDDAEVFLARAGGADGRTAAAGEVLLVPAAAPTAGRGLRLRPGPRRLPPLPVRDASQRGIEPPPRCQHPLVSIPRDAIAGAFELARATPEVEIGAGLVVEAFALDDGDTRRLVVQVVACVPLAHGTTGEANRLRVSPEALAALPVSADAGRLRGGLLHSHPHDEGEPAHFLSVDDVAMAASFFWSPWQIQLVLDPTARTLPDAVAAFAWLGGRLARVCVQWTDGPAHPGGDT